MPSALTGGARMDKSGLVEMAGPARLRVRQVGNELNGNRGRNPAGRVTAGTGQTVRAAALAVQFLFALQWPPLHEVWVCHSIVFVEVRHSTPKPEMESEETPTP